MTERRRLRRALLAALLLAVAVMAYVFASEEWIPARNLLLARASGWLALIALIAGLSVRPFGRVLRSATVWRRSLGICTAFFTTLHVVVSFVGPLRDAWQSAFSWKYLLFGVLGYVVLLLLFGTSFPRANRVLRVRHWRVLHRLVYAAAFFVAAHIVLSPWGDVVVKSAAAALLGSLLLYRLRR